MSLYAEADKAYKEAHKARQEALGEEAALLLEATAIPAWIVRALECHLVGQVPSDHRFWGLAKRVKDMDFGTGDFPGI